MAHERAILAGGCFWGMEELFRHEAGVIATRCGYTGGDIANATYKNHGTHAEAIEVIFDDTKTDYKTLLKFFFKIHDPTTENRQGNDIGTSYRSAIFYLTEEQKNTALEMIDKINASDKWPGQAVTRVEAATEFWEAEPEHQNYLQNYPNGYTCHFVRNEWNLD